MHETDIVAKYITVHTTKSYIMRIFPLEGTLPVTSYSGTGTGYGDWIQFSGIYFKYSTVYIPGFTFSVNNHSQCNIGIQFGLSGNSVYSGYIRSVYAYVTGGTTSFSVHSKGVVGPFTQVPITNMFRFFIEESFSPPYTIGTKTITLNSSINRLIQVER